MTLDLRVKKILNLYHYTVKPDLSDHLVITTKMITFLRLKKVQIK